MKIFKTNDVEVFYEENMDGGGTSFGQEYIHVIQTRYNRKFNNCLEWCAGPGFIGFSLLSNQICDNISFLEFYNPAINCLQLTKNHNKKYSNKIKIFKSNKINIIPEEEKYDLIVGNPPHFSSDLDFLNYLNIDRTNKIFEISGTTTRLVVDSNWRAHKNFFKNIKKNLSDNGVILLQENIYGSNKKLFFELVNFYGLEILDAFFCDDSKYNNTYYYLEIKHKKNEIKYF